MVFCARLSILEASIQLLVCLLRIIRKVLSILFQMPVGDFNAIRDAVAEFTEAVDDFLAKFREI